jgi:ABC-type Na+ efflux pump permease subunit
LWSGRPIGTILLTVTIGYVIALIVKIGFDLQVDPTSHNLFPFEVLISGFVAFVAALLGAAIGMIYKRFRKNIP